MVYKHQYNPLAETQESPPSGEPLFLGVRGRGPTRSATQRPTREAETFVGADCPPGTKSRSREESWLNLRVQSWGDAALRGFEDPASVPIASAAAGWGPPCPAQAGGGRCPTAGDVRRPRRGPSRSSPAGIPLWPPRGNRGRG